MKYKSEILKNLVSLGSVDVLGLLIPILTMPILSRALGPELYGQYLLFLTVITFGFTIIDYGIHYTGVREVAAYKSNKVKCKDIYELNQGVRLVFALLYFMLMSFYAFFYISADLLYYYIVGGGLYILGHFLTSSWFFQGLSDTKWLLYAALISRLLNLIAILFFVNEKNDFNIAVYSLTIPIFISGLFLFIIARKKHAVCFCVFKGIAEQLRKGFDVFIGILSPNLYNAIPVMILGAYSEATEFAIFAVAMRLCGIVSVVLNVLSKAIYPIISRDDRNHIKAIFIANLLISLPSFVFLSIFGDFFINLFLGADYVGDVNYLLILSMGMIFVGIANAYGTGYLLANSHDRVYRNATIKVSLIACIIAIMSIYFFSLEGGAFSLTIARAILAFEFILQYKRLEQRKIITD